MLRRIERRGAAVRALVLPAFGTLVLLTVILGPANAPAAADTSALRAAGWEALWGNRLAAADSLFAAAVKADGRDAEALRGHVLALLARGRDDELVAAVRDYTRLLPTGPYDDLLPELVDQNTGLGSRAFYDVLLRYMVKLSEAKDLSIVDRRRVAGQAIQYALLAGRPEEGARLASRLNRVEYWALLGPFDNTSGCGHGKRHIESYSVSGQVYQGKFGQNVSWFRPTLVGLDRSIAPDNYFARDGYNTAYLRTNVQLPKAGRYLISVSHQGDVEFMLNRTVVHAGSRHMGGDENLHWLVDLPAGPNRLAFKLSSREDGGRLSCAVSLPNGEAVPGLEFMPLKNAMPDSGAYTAPERVESATRAEIARRVAADPQDIEAAFWNLRRAARDDDPDSVRALTGRLRSRHGSSVLVMLAVARAQARHGDEDAALEDLRAAAQADSTLVPARMAVAAEDLERKRPDLALRAARSVLRRAYTCRSALAIKMQALTDRQDLEGVREMGEELKLTLRDDPLPWQALMSYATSRGQVSEARRNRDEYLKRLPPGGRELQRIRESWDREDLSKARGPLEDLLAVVPDQAWLWSLYVQALLDEEWLDDAKETLEKALLSFPQSVTLLDLKSRLEEAGAYQEPVYVNSESELEQARAMHKVRCQAAAAETLQKALTCDPANPAIRDRLRTLRNLPSFRTYLPDPKPDSLAARRVEPSLYPGQDAVVLLEQRRLFIFDAQAHLSDTVLAVQVLTAAGVEQWENYDLGANRFVNDLVVLLARTVKPDGAISEARHLSSGVVFTDLAPGDILLLHYQLTSMSTGALFGHVWDQHIFAFPGTPCRESTYTLVRPADRKVGSRLWHAPGADGGALPSRTLSHGFVSEEWRFTDLPKYGDEPMAASALAYVPWLDLSTIPDWSIISRWYADLADGQAEPTPAVRRKAAELAAGAADETEIMRRLLHFVGNEITYQSLPFFQSAHVPRQAGDVLEDRFGDCKDKSCLLIALARAAGIANCRFALTTPWAPPGIRFLPSPRFNHVVVTRSGGADAASWYDPTIRHADPAILPLALQGVVALPADAETADLVTIAPVVPTPDVRSSSHVALDARGDAKLTRRIVQSRGDGLAAARDRLESISDDELAEYMAQQMAIDFPGATVTSATATGRADADSALVLACEADIPAFGESTGDIISTRIPWSTGLSDVVGAVVGKAGRRSPIDLRAINLAEADEVQIDFAGITSRITPPPAVELAWKDCSYRTTFTSAPGRLTVRRVLVISGLLVGEADYAGFKDFVEQVRRDMRRGYLLRRG